MGCVVELTLPFLCAILPKILEIVKYYAISKDLRADDARKSVNKQYGRKKPFHTSVWADLKLLLDVSGSFTAADQEQLASVWQDVHDFLLVLEEDFVAVPESATRGDADGTTRRPVHAAHMPACCDELDGLASLLDMTGEDSVRLEWMLGRTEFQRPKRGAQKRIVESTRRCRRTLKFNEAAVRTTRADSIISLQPSLKKELDRKDASLRFDTACGRLEHMHECWRETWVCDCTPSHMDSKFSLEPPGDDDSADDDTLSCLVVYPSGSSTLGWRRARLKFRCRRADSSHRCAVDNLCEDLEQLNSNSNLNSCSPRESAAGWNVSIHGVCSAPVPLDRVIVLETAVLRERLVLALYLSHMYLHLSGGPWWPYEQTETSIWFHKPLQNHWRFSLPYLSVPSVHSCGVTVFGRSMNPAMPSFPVFGKMLLEIYIGRDLAWQQVDDALKDCRDQPFASHINTMVEACFTEAVFKSGGSLRTEERMRLEFKTRIIDVLHMILNLAFQVNFTDILRNLALPPPHESGARRTEISKGTPSESKIACDPGSLCLYDDGEEKSVDTKDARNASRWLERLHASVKQHAITSDAGQAPVKIAILDTGAEIDEDTLDFVYQSRLRERRSWLDEAAGPTGLLLQTGGDDDGHGTHTTSLALEVTRDSKCEIYVAQVFRTRQEKQSTGTTAATQKAIARAINCAVNSWHADVISMSFGCDLPVAIVESELIKARTRGTLLFAAASNCGGNASTSWPARHDSVIPIYATEGLGNKYEGNPSPDARRSNFAVVGSSLKGCWPPDDKGARQIRYRSGTSGATPIAAGIAGVLLELMRGGKNDYLSRFDERRRQKESQSYDEHLKTLRSPAGMRDVFALMSAGKRDGYDYVTPWSILDQGESWEVVHMIIQKLKKC